MTKRLILIGLGLCLFLFAVVVGLRATVVTPGLVAGWRFEGTGADWSGRGHTMTDWRDTTWNTSQKFGNGLVLDGVDACTTTSDHADFTLSNGFTLSAWINLSTSTLSTSAGIVSQWRILSGNGAWIMFLNSTRYLSIGVTDSVTGYPTLSDTTTQLAASTWYHAAVVYAGGTTGTNGLIYVNGVLVASGTLNKIPFNSTTQIFVGGCKTAITGGVSYPFPGNIDEVMIFNRALTSGEIRNLMTGTSPGEVND